MLFYPCGMKADKSVRNLSREVSDCISADSVIKVGLLAQVPVCNSVVGLHEIQVLRKRPKKSSSARTSLCVDAALSIHTVILTAYPTTTECPSAVLSSRSKFVFRSGHAFKRDGRKVRERDKVLQVSIFADTICVPLLRDAYFYAPRRRNFSKADDIAPHA